MPPSALQGVTESGRRSTATASLIERDSASIKSGVSNEQIMALPVGQEYRDLVKLIPGVQYTNDQTRGPSAGGSGQDNVYQFDGVNVTLPLFGTLSAEPASHDIAQVTTIKGGARAVDFDRSGGFSIDSVSKSGREPVRRRGQLSVPDAGHDRRPDERRAVALRRRPQLAHRQRRRPGDSRTACTSTRSYYRPGQHAREPVEPLRRAAGVPSCTRDEGFGKVTVTPASSVLLNFSYRGSDREDRSNRFAANQAATTGSGNEAQQQIGIAEGSWVVNSRSLLTFKYTHFAYETTGTPDIISDATFSDAIGTRLDIANLDRMGRLTVPAPIAGQTAYNAFIQPMIDRYGYVASTASGPAAASTASPRSSTRTTSSATPARSATTSRSARRSRTTCTSGISGTPTRRI